MVGPLGLAILGEYPYKPLLIDFIGFKPLKINEMKVTIAVPGITVENSIRELFEYFLPEEKQWLSNKIKRQKNFDIRKWV